MLHQDPKPWVPCAPRDDRDSAEPVAVLAYRSRALAVASGIELDRILAEAQTRNQAEGLTGLLVYGRGCFFQWLEGPASALGRVWASIRRDARHTDIELLREDTVPKRVFPTWDMRIAHDEMGSVQMAAAVAAPGLMVKRLRGKPSAIAEERWRQLFASAVIPDILSSHGIAGAATPLPADAAIAHIARGLLNSDARGHAEQIVASQGPGAQLQALYAQVCEPVQRYLGDLHARERCNEFQLTLALANLQLQVRRLGQLTADSAPLQGARSVLMAAHPGEAHGAGMAMSSELLLREGWDVCCEFPRCDKSLCDLLRRRWFDVLQLSSSGAVRRDSQLPSIRDLIRAARSASLNPCLAVIADGRVFFEQPQAYLAVEADAGCGGALEIVAAADRLSARSHLRH